MVDDGVFIFAVGAGHGCDVGGRGGGFSGGTKTLMSIKKMNNHQDYENEDLTTMIPCSKAKRPKTYPPNTPTNTPSTLPHI